MVLENGRVSATSIYSTTSDSLPSPLFKQVLFFSSHICVSLSFYCSTLEFLHFVVALYILDSSNKLPVTFTNQIFSTDILVTSMDANWMPLQINGITLYLPPIRAFQFFQAHLSIKETLLHGGFTGKHGLYESLQREWRMKRTVSF